MHTVSTAVCATSAKLTLLLLINYGVVAGVGGEDVVLMLGNTLPVVLVEC